MAVLLLAWSSGGSDRDEYHSAVSCMPLNSNSFAFRSCPCKDSISFFRWCMFASNELCIGSIDDMDASETFGKTFGWRSSFFAVAAPLFDGLACFSDVLSDELLDISEMFCL